MVLVFTRRKYRESTMDYFVAILVLILTVLPHLTGGQSGNVEPLNKIIAPVQNEVVYQKLNYRIRWRADTDASNNVTIHLLTLPGSVILKDGAPNTGEYVWYVPDYLRTGQFMMGIITPKIVDCPTQPCRNVSLSGTFNVQKMPEDGPPSNTTTLTSSSSSTAFTTSRVIFTNPGVSSSTNSTDTNPAGSTATNDPPDVTSDDKNGLSGGTIAGIAVGAIAGFSAIAILVLLLWRSRRKQKQLEMNQAQYQAGLPPPPYGMGMDPSVYPTQLDSTARNELPPVKDGRVGMIQELEPGMVQPGVPQELDSNQQGYPGQEVKEEVGMVQGGEGGR